MHQPFTRLPIGYINTDLDLVSRDDLTALATVLEANGVWPLHVHRTEDGDWRARFETDDQYEEPELTITAILDAIDALDASVRSSWEKCIGREFNVGYELKPGEWAFSQRLSDGLLSRLARAGASLRVTLYPAEKEPPHREKGRR